MTKERVERVKNMCAIALWIVVPLCFLCTGIYSYFWGEQGLVAKRALQVEVEELRTENQNLEARGEYLVRRIEGLKNKDLILVESYARERLGMIGKDEYLLIFNSKKDP